MAFEANSNASGDAPVTGINVTPLVDVVLVLLVVLMVAASGAISEALPLDLPSAATGQATDSVLLRVGIGADGALSIDGRVADLEELRRAVQLAQTKDPEVRAAIAADGGARHEQVVAVLDTLRAGGLTRVAIQVSTQKP